MTQQFGTLGRDFVPASMGPLTDFASGLPAGEKQPAQLMGALVERVGDSQNGKLTLTWKIIGGPNTGAVGNHILNIFHSNEKAAEIAWKTLAKIAHCMGRGNQNLNNLAMLKDGQVLLDVVPQKGEKGEQGYTEVPDSGIYALNGAKPYMAGGGAPAQAPPQTVAPVAPAAAPAGAPWEQQATPAAAAPAAQPAGNAPPWAGGGGAPAAGAPPWAT